MGIRTLSFESMVRPPRNRKPKPQKCFICGGEAAYPVCVACTPRGAALQRALNTYESECFSTKSPIPDDIYTALAMKGTLTVKRLAVEINISIALLEIYISRLVKRRTITVHEVGTRRGQLARIVELTDKGKSTSRAYQIICEFEATHGERILMRLQDGDQPQSMAG